MEKEKLEKEIQETESESPEVQREQEEAEKRLEEPKIPEEIPILPLRSTVVFPLHPATLHVGRKSSMELIDSVIVKDRLIGLVAQKDEKVEQPQKDDLFGVGTVVYIEKLLKFKGFQSQDYKQFKSKKYKNVSQNARKSDTKTPINGLNSDTD